MAMISQTLNSVDDWKGLAIWLNIESNTIETDCAQDVAKAACYRRTLVQWYCNKQSSDNPSKVAEDIAKALDEMDYKYQAEKLRQLQFGKWVGKGRSPLGETEYLLL